MPGLHVHTHICLCTHVHTCTHLQKHVHIPYTDTHPTHTLHILERGRQRCRLQYRWVSEEMGLCTLQAQLKVGTKPGTGTGLQWLLGSPKAHRAATLSLVTSQLKANWEDASQTPLFSLLALSYFP